MTLSVSQLFIYPVKSCRGIKLDKVELGKYGFHLDRLWAVTTEEYKSVTARSHPKLVTIIQSLQKSSSDESQVMVKLEIEGNKAPLLLDPTAKPQGSKVQVAIWDDMVDGYDCGEESALWLSEALGEKLRLVIKGTQPRKVGDFYLKRDGLGHIQSETAFADGFPILLASEESLSSLKNELPQDIKDTIGMRNFRPNLVFRGCSKPYEEDEFGIIRIGEVKFHCDKPCARCTFPNVDPETGIPHKTEPSKTLMKSRRTFPHIYKYNAFFGINIIPLHNEGSIEVGQSVEVITRTEK